MSQKYKVFFNNNKLFIANKQLPEINFKAIFTNPNKEDIKDLIAMLLNSELANNYLIITDNLNKTWQEFKLFFEIRKAAGGLVENKKGERLFIKRKGFWDLPKGHLEKNEKNRGAAVREVQEECGINNVKIERKLVKTYHTYVLKKAIVLKPTKWYLMSYDGKSEPKPQTDEGITDVEWADKSREKEMKKNIFSSIIEVLNRADS